MQTLQQQRRARTRSFAWRLSALIALIVVLWAASLMFGETFYGPQKTLQVLIGETVPGASFTVGELRLPRATVAVAAGIAFGIAGVTFQTMLRNQLASPDIIGISSGASAAGITAIVFFQCFPNHSLDVVAAVFPRCCRSHLFVVAQVRFHRHPPDSHRHRYGRNLAGLDELRAFESTVL